MVYVEVGLWSDIAPPIGSVVVVGYNGKEHSRSALEWAATESARSRSPLLVLYAANYSGMTGPEAPGLLEREAGALEAAQEVTAQGVSEALDSQLVLSITGATEVTSPVEALTEASRAAALVVLGSRGYGRVARVLLRSVAFSVAARAACPVVVVKDGLGARPVGPGHPVVVGTDGSPAAAAAVRFAAARAAPAGAELHIVSCTGGRDLEVVDVAASRAAAHHIAQAAATGASTTHPGLTVETRVEDCPAELTLVAASYSAGMVVVGTQGRGAFEAMLLGSVSHAVIHGSTSAVAIVSEGQA